MTIKTAKPGIDYSTLPRNALLRDRQIAGIVVPASQNTIWRWVREGRFPQPIRLPEGRVTAWTWGSVSDWLDAQATGGHA